MVGVGVVFGVVFGVVLGVALGVVGRIGRPKYMVLLGRFLHHSATF